MRRRRHQWRSRHRRCQRERKRIDTTCKTTAQRWGEARARERAWSVGLSSEKEVASRGQVASRFIDGHARAPHAKLSGIAHKELVFQEPTVPDSRHKAFHDLTDEDVQQLKYKLRHRTPCTVNNVLNVLSMILKKAGEWRVLDHRDAKCAS